MSCALLVGIFTLHEHAQRKPNSRTIGGKIGMSHPSRNASPNCSAVAAAAGAGADEDGRR